LVLALPLVAAEPKAHVEDGRIAITGITSSKGLSVVVAEGTEADIAARPAMSGEWTTDAGRVVFAPKYPLKPGTKYRVIGTAAKLEVQTKAVERGESTAVTGVYPTGPDLPANVLRFYVQFNRAMPRGDVYRFVQVIDDAGKPVEQPFLEMDDELWNPGQTRLTLLIDPGRIKKEVKPRIDLGPVFRAGKKYKLVIRGKWPDLDGRPLGTDVVRPFNVGPPIADAVDPKAWKVSPPTASQAILSVKFDRPMDRALLESTLTVIGLDGREVVGTAEITGPETGWSFRPKAGWVDGEYKLRVEPVLEDVCGNAVGRPFEVDLQKPAVPAPRQKPVELPFRVAR
jgi:hypothetical protein